MKRGNLRKTSALSFDDEDEADQEPLARDRKLTEEGAAPSGSDAEADDEDRGRMVFGLGTRSDAPGQLAALAAAGATALASLRAAVDDGRARALAAAKQRDRTAAALRTAVASVETLRADLDRASEKYVDVQRMRAYAADLNAGAWARQEAQRKAEAGDAALERLVAALPGSGVREAGSTGSPDPELEFHGATSSESEGDVDEYRNTRDKILQAGWGLDFHIFVEDIGEIVVHAADTLFLDAAEPYGTLRAVRAELDGWRRRQPAAYRDAYVAAAAPALFAPWVRLELLAWEPLDARAPFTDLAWYSQLFTFGQGDEQEGAAGEGGPAATTTNNEDDLTVPRLVSSLVLPAARRALAPGAWSPLSVRQSRGAAALLAALEDHLPGEEAAVAELNAGLALDRLLAGALLPAVSATPAITPALAAERGARMAGALLPPWIQAVPRHPAVAALGENLEALRARQGEGEAEARARLETALGMLGA
ncbi:PAX3- and PAX7-binding protein 1 [Auxenochlorella protothecoides]|uniref:PAX3-and PAX7-binding protein 1 n=1 Tax=Auxenochlorella protothecoides TaxID=3075 RepID=A0A087SF61_AUXPR|nr:PAX3- and PAX7-binding protein 1 [Auxenochlorella protothecoides]KFM24365.1 PAX3- and PAX7-binding protein 1 [Auxenochlorella protothecoides]